MASHFTGFSILPPPLGQRPLVIYIKVDYRLTAQKQETGHPAHMLMVSLSSVSLNFPLRVHRGADTAGLVAVIVAAFTQ